MKTFRIIWLNEECHLKYEEINAKSVDVKEGAVVFYNAHGSIFLVVNIKQTILIEEIK